MRFKIQTILSSKFFITFSAFILGALFTYFATNYLNSKNKIKSNQEKEITQQNNSKIQHKHFLKQKNEEKQDPFAQMNQLHNQMKKQIDQVFGSSMFSANFFDDSFLTTNPFKNMQIEKIKIEEDEDNNFKYIKIFADKIDKNSINVKVSDGIISISSELKEENDHQSEDFHSISSSISSFSRSFSIPYGVIEEDVKIENQGDKVVIKFPKRKI